MRPRSEFAIGPKDGMARQCDRADEVRSADTSHAPFAQRRSSSGMLRTSIAAGILLIWRTLMIAGWPPVVVATSAPSMLGRSEAERTRTLPATAEGRTAR